jgi:putative membrane protein
VLCLAVFTVVWVALAFSPKDRADWFLENSLSFVAVPLVVLGYRRFRFSDRAYVQGTIFLILHTIGAHWTYSEVPIGDWARDAFGLARNHYDRVVHFLFGVLMLRPIREVGFRGRPPGRFATFYFTVAGVGLWSLLYEVLEWAVATVVDPKAGTAYLGTQGDQWDAEKDMALAALGAVLAGLFEWRLERRTRPARAS